MTTEKIMVIYEAKEGSRYTETWRNEDPAEVYKDLAEELINKKLNECRYIRSIRRKNLFNGFQQITVTYDHGGRRTYTVKNS